MFKGEQAAAQSNALIRLFKQMKDCIAENRQFIGDEFFFLKNRLPG